ncbi:hypothetical protein [Spartinivicinus ruber]|uniref:hypothetical protein n=1 Tax=Spartinivicinus ruber TaxID=2683272 RepID=UPI0013D00A19|nr:hypothetical protein [Spartinivicinus ruber]
MDIKQVSCLSLTSLLFASSLTAASEYTHQLGRPSVSSASTAFLGAAFDSDASSSWPSTCLNGSPVIDNPGNTTQTISLNSKYNYSKLEDKLDIKVNGDLNLFDIIKMDDEQKFKRTVEETDTSYTLLLSYSYKAPVVRYNLPNAGNRLTELGQQALDQGIEAFYRLCGDAYISQLERGGSLFVSIKLDFANKSIKDEFKASANFNFADFGSVKATLNKTRNKYSNFVNIYLTAHQIGGDQLALGNILGVVSGDKIKACYSSTENSYNCGTIIDNLSTYVSANGPLLKSWKNNPAVTGVITTSYSEVLLNNPQHSSELTQAIINSRAAIYNKFKEQQKMLSRIETVLSTDFSPLLQERWNKVLGDYNEAKSFVRSNIEALKYATGVCYSSLNTCNITRKNTIANLAKVKLPVDPYSVYDIGEVRVGKGGTEKYCRAPELSVIVGVGARVKGDDVKGIRIGYRKLLASGSLGSVQHKQCGSGYEKYVEAPSGHVLTGIEFRIKSDNVAAINILSKKWNHTLRKLTGSVLSTNSGTGYEQSLDLRIDQINNRFYNTNHVVLTGIGLRSSSDDASGITGTVGWIY